MTNHSEQSHCPNCGGPLTETAHPTTCLANTAAEMQRLRQKLADTAAGADGLWNTLARIYKQYPGLAADELRNGIGSLAALPSERDAGR